MSAYEGSKMQERDEDLKNNVTFRGQLKNNKITFSDKKLNPKTPQDYLGSFLLKNGFALIEGKNHYANDMCGVVINESNIEVANNEGYVMYSQDLNIYWLVGYLTYSNFIPKNYIL